MKKSAIVCAVLAGTFGFSSLASAQEWRGHERGHDRDPRVEQRHDGRDDRAHRGDRRDDRRFGRGYAVEAPRPVYQQPNRFHGQPTYRTEVRRFHRGGYLPHQYRSHAYYVNDWRAYPALYAPPYGQQWVNVDGEFLLVAVATGLILNSLLN